MDTRLDDDSWVFEARFMLNGREAIEAKYAFERALNPPFIRIIKSRSYRISKIATFLLFMILSAFNIIPYYMGGVRQPEGLIGSLWWVVFGTSVVLGFGESLVVYMNYVLMTYRWYLRRRREIRSLSASQLMDRAVTFRADRTGLFWRMAGRYVEISWAGVSFISTSYGFIIDHFGEKLLVPRRVFQSETEFVSTYERWRDACASSMKTPGIQM